jgi:hypothetical protein
MNRNPHSDAPVSRRHRFLLVLGCTYRFSQMEHRKPEHSVHWPKKIAIAAVGVPDTATNVKSI